MKRHAPATERNRDVIAEVLAKELPASGLVLEIASGTGEHAVHFARKFPGLQWQPSDPDPAAVASIAAWREESGSANLRPPLELSTLEDAWPLHHADAIFCANMIHISPWSSARGLFHQGARLLEQGAPLILYGPFLEAGIETAPSNLAFDESLRTRDASWGLRHTGDVDALSQGEGFIRASRHEMPANNLALVYRRA